jgi:hypothetical protein
MTLPTPPISPMAHHGHGHPSTPPPPLLLASPPPPITSNPVVFKSEPLSDPSVAVAVVGGPRLLVVVGVVRSPLGTPLARPMICTPTSRSGAKAGSSQLGGACKAAATTAPPETWLISTVAG